MWVAAYGVTKRSLEHTDKNQYTNQLIELAETDFSKQTYTCFITNK